METKTLMATVVGLVAVITIVGAIMVPAIDDATTAVDYDEYVLKDKVEPGTPTYIVPPSTITSSTSSVSADASASATDSSSDGGTVS